MIESRTLFIHGHQSVNKAQFETLIKKYSFPLHAHVLAKIDNPILFNAVLIAALLKDVNLYLCPFHYKEEDVQALLKKLSIQFYVTDREIRNLEKKESSKTGSLIIFTSGTSGPPKMAQYNWDAIQHSSLKAQTLKKKTWLMTYEKATYAGLQIFFSAYNNEGVIYYPERAEDLPKRLIELGIQIISATPSYWKMLINKWPLTVPPLRLEQATLGGEIVQQDVIDLIRNFFHPKKITHIYASSEGGTTIIVSDELAGFPVNYLENGKDIKIRIRDGILQVKTPYGMQSYIEKKSSLTPDGWIDTGDLVEIKGDRVYFLGRNDEVINVGGMKVNPEEVENVLEQLDEIENACVFAKKNPVTGNIVAAHVVLKKGTHLDIASIIQRARTYLADFKIPRYIKQVMEIEVSANGKKIRPK